MNVSSLMQRKVAMVRPTDRLDRAAALMRAHECGSVVVVDDRRRPVAMATDRDAFFAALRSGRPLAAIPVADAMSARLFTCRSDDAIDDAHRAMALHQVRRLPVVDAGGALVGVLALDDIAREACREQDLFAPAVSCSAVGRTLGQIVRPHLIEGESARVTP